MISCVFCLNRLQHPYWCYILTDRRFNSHKAGQAIVAKIGLSRHPIHRVNCHNRRKGYRVGASTKSTKAGAGYYQIEFMVGPFYDGNGIRFKQKWSTKRTTLPRLVRGLELARRYQYMVAARDKAWLSAFARRYLK